MNYILYNANFHASNTKGGNTGVPLWNACMAYLPHKRALNEYDLGRREIVQHVKRLKGREKNGRLKTASQLMKAKQRVFLKKSGVASESCPL